MSLLSRLSFTRLALACASGVALAGCTASHAHSGRGSPPRAEFLLSSDDSTFWVSTTSGETRVRGAPIVLAHYDGRWYELYTTDDDLSYDDALLLGQRVYRRDLLTGDSTIVFADTTVPRVADAYARAHPGERPLDPNEDGEADPSTSATAEVDILDVHGPYLSYEYRVDITLPGRRDWHSARRGVLDLRSGHGQRVADLFDPPIADKLTADARHSYNATRDSVLHVRRSLSGDERLVADAIRRRPFDVTSFSLSDVDGRPGVSFGVPGLGEGASGKLMQLDAVAPDSGTPPPSWWSAASVGLPATDDQDNDRWTGAGYHVLARYDTSGQVAHLSLADSSNREWPVATVQAPLSRIQWLDRPPIGAAERRALVRAFNEASSYDGGARVALAAGAPPAFHLVIRHATHQARPRKPTRDLRADDARAREQPGARVRGRGPLDHGQSRGDRRLSALPRERRDGLDRSSRFSRTDPSGRSGGHEGERELRGTNVDGGRGAGRS